MRTLKICPKHGEQPHYEHKDRKRTKLVCPVCNVERVQARRDKIKALAVEHKGGKCEVCGYDKCIGALEFHHLDPDEKEFTISGSGHTRSLDRVLEEIEKCILLCANCHREVHAGILLV